MKTLNINIHTHLRFAAVILAVGSFTVAGSVHAGDDVPIKGYAAGATGERVDDIRYSNLSGKMSHLGRIEIEVSIHVFDDVIQLEPDGEPREKDAYELGPNLVQITQMATFTAANGDKIFSTQTTLAIAFYIAVDDDDTEEDETLYFLPSQELFYSGKITGGTGRFLDATGAFTAVGLYTFNPLDYTDHLEVWIEGTISTVGSRRGNAKN